MSKDVLVPVRWLGPVSYGSRIVHADLNRDAVIHAPDFVPATLPDADYEMRVLSWYDHPSRRPRLEQRSLSTGEAGRGTDGTRKD